MWFARSLLKYIHFDILESICPSCSFFANFCSKNNRTIHPNTYNTGVLCIKRERYTHIKQQQLVIMWRGHNLLEQLQCNRRVRNLCNKAAGSYHGKCDERRDAVLFSGCDINDTESFYERTIAHLDNECPFGPR